jgi:curli biogenesis system outer membrane secretion channel CsgG
MRKTLIALAIAALAACDTAPARPATLPKHAAILTYEVKVCKPACGKGETCDHATGKCVTKKTEPVAAVPACAPTLDASPLTLGTAIADALAGVGQ